MWTRFSDIFGTVVALRPFFNSRGKHLSNLSSMHALNRTINSLLQLVYLGGKEVACNRMAFHATKIINEL